jgi:hypothetical protein
MRLYKLESGRSMMKSMEIENCDDAWIDNG